MNTRSKSPKHFKVEDVSLLENFLDGHQIDFVKERVAFDLEWNSKDQTFDRDLYAMRAFYDCGIIDVGIILTRSTDLSKMFADIGSRAESRMKIGIPTFIVSLRISASWSTTTLSRLRQYSSAVSWGR